MKLNVKLDSSIDLSSMGKGEVDSHSQIDLPVLFRTQTGRFNRSNYYKSVMVA